MKKYSFLAVARRAAMLFLLPLLLGGCGDLVEIQDRNFVLALGISYHDGQYRVTYCLPDLTEATEQSTSADHSSLIRTYEGTSLAEIERIYNFNSDSRLDYRHLQVIILADSLCADSDAMKQVLIQINDNYNLSHNALVYYYRQDVEKLLATEGINSSMGEHLKKLNHNTGLSRIEPAKIGALIDCLANERTLYIPALFVRDNSIALDGGVFFRQNQAVKQISQEDSDYYYLSRGKGRSYFIRMAPDYLIELKEVKAKTYYELTSQGPRIELLLTGTAKEVPGACADNSPWRQKRDEFLQEQIDRQLAEWMKQGGLDYLNLYEKSSYQHRDIWLLYENRPADFIADTTVHVTVNLRSE